MEKKNPETSTNNYVGNVSDIAIIGISCRFPGATDYNEFWENLVRKKSSITEIPADRWDWRKYYGDPKINSNKTNIKWGGFIEDVDKFDPLFFNISPREANCIDPQHRIFLEAVWKAIEDAGYSIQSLSDKKIGVYAGVSKNDYAELMREVHEDILPYISTGTVHSILVNRVSYLLNLRGKSEAVDTACSSSLVALHNAIRDIRNGDCESALVGGVNALLSPTMFISHSKSGMLSIDGECKSFDEKANGYVRGEGVGVLFIKPLKKAIADHDYIYGIIKGTAINHGGRSNFLTSPNVNAQAEVVAEAIENANLDPNTITYIEAHGTGTSLGDPIEINGLKKAFALAREKYNNANKNAKYCGISSVKTNIGHLESAAGVAGIIKVLMAMKHQTIPGLQNFRKQNPYIDISDSPFFFVSSNTEWKNSAGEKTNIPKRAGISSFGMGGVNAHVIIEEPPKSTYHENKQEYYLVVLSAKKNRLKDYVKSLNNFLINYDKYKCPHLQLENIAFTLQTGRDEFEERVAFIVNSIDDLILKSNKFLENHEDKFILKGQADIKESKKSILEISGLSSPDSFINVASEWVAGRKVNWHSLYNNQPYRIPLPTYPFNKIRCWFKGNEIDHSSEKTGTFAHPLIDSYIVSDNKVQFYKKLSLKDFYIHDHIVSEKPTFPGVCYLETALAVSGFFQDKTANKLTNIYWLSPVIVNGSTDIIIDLETNENNNLIKLSEKGNLCFKGELEYEKQAVKNSEPISIENIIERFSEHFAKHQIYPDFIRNGLNYGPSFQVIKSFHYNENEAVAEIQLPDVIKTDINNFIVHPSLFDGIFQSVVAFMLFAMKITERQYLPYSVKEIEFSGNVQENCFAHITQANNDPVNKDSQKFNVCVYDKKGNLLIRINEFLKRPIAQKTAGTTNHFYFCPTWIGNDINISSDTIDSLIIFDSKNEIYNKIKENEDINSVILIKPAPSFKIQKNTVFINPEDYSHYQKLINELKKRNIRISNILYLNDYSSPSDKTIYSVFYLSKALIHSKYYKTVKLIYAYNNNIEFNRAHSMIAGFSKTLYYENPHFNYRIVGIDDETSSVRAKILLQELCDSSAENIKEITYQNNTRKIKSFKKLTVTDRQDESVIRINGTYIITGGAGGLGFTFSKYLAENYKTNLVWIGKSAYNDEIKLKISAIEMAGGTASYFSTDVANADELKKTFLSIKEKHATINGIIHAAGLIDDAFILKKDTDSFRKVTAPKVTGTINLDEISKDENLDFFVFFSSIAAIMPNQGQCDYAAGNSFMDYYAGYRNNLVQKGARKGKTLSINWPLWKNGGINVTEQEALHLKKVFGMYPLETDEGIQFFENVLCSVKSHENDLYNQILLISGNREKINKQLNIINAKEETASELSQLISYPDFLKNYVLQKLTDIFSNIGETEKSNIDISTDFSSYGINSLKLITLVNQINHLLGVVINPSILFEINTIHRLADYLIKTFGSQIKSYLLTTDNILNTRKTNSYPFIDVEKSDIDNLKFEKTFLTSEFHLKDHVVDKQYNLLGASYIEMAWQAGELVEGNRNVTRISKNYWIQPLSSSGTTLKAFLNFEKKDAAFNYKIYSRNNGNEITHAVGQLSFVTNDVPGNINIAEIKKRCHIIKYPEEIYEKIWAEGLIVGSSLQPIKEIRQNNNEVLALINLPLELTDTFKDFGLHPTILSGAFQAILINNRENIPANVKFRPIGIDDIIIHNRLTANCYVYGKITDVNTSNNELKKYNGYITDLNGEILVECLNMSIRAIRTDAQAMEKKANFENGKKENDYNKEVTGYFKKILADAIDLPPDQFHENEDFENYGINSVVIMELNRILENVFGPLSITLFFEYRNLHELTNYFIDNHLERIKEIIDIKEEPKPVLNSVSNDLKFREEAVASDWKPVYSNKETNKIAVIGISGRYPKADNIPAFWNNLISGKDCIVEIPQERFDYRQYQNKHNPDYYISSKWGGFIEGIDEFDPLFFNISPKEANILDPQARLLMEIVWETLEDSGYTRENIEPEKSNVGVFIGAIWPSYVLSGLEETLKGNPVVPDAYLYNIANRVSYFFNFHGPSLTLDTACSSSLIALHLACSSIASGECKLALAGGVNLSLRPEKFRFLSKYNFLSNEGKCRSFGDGGNGYVPGEGIGALLLKPLSQAIEDNDNIYAIILSTVSNHGGKTNGYTVPNPNAQADLIAEAIDKAGIHPRTISYIEAHGTGTSLGDPIEITGLSKAFSKHTGDKQFCAIGSVKSNIGHLEAAAGIASVTKTILQMRFAKLVPTLHAETPNKNIHFSNTPFFIQKTLEDWHRPEIDMGNGIEEFPRRAAISSFGAGGSNAHVILEEYEHKNISSSENRTRPYLILLSAKNKDRLTEYSKRLMDFLRNYSAIRRTDTSINELVINDIGKIVSQLLKVNIDDIDKKAGLNEIGFDVYNYTELENALKNKYDIREHIVTDNISVESLSKLLISKYQDNINRHYKIQENEITKPVNLDGIEYNLQLGREEMEERLAIIASGLDDLIVKLAYFIQGQAGKKDILTGNISETKYDEKIIEDEIGTDFLKNLVAHNKVSKIARLWIAGEKIDWSLLYDGNKYRKISLPHYPFEKIRYWLDMNEKTDSVSRYDCEMKKKIDNQNSSGIQLSVKSLSEKNHSVDRDRLISENQKAVIAVISGLLMINENKITRENKISDYGFDSLTFTALAKKINEKYGINITPVIFFEYPSVKRISEYLCDNFHDALLKHHFNLAENHTPVAESMDYDNNISFNQREDTFKETISQNNSGSDNPVAVIGMHGVFPQSENLDVFWTNIEKNKNLISEIPPERWDWREYYGNPSAGSNKTLIKWAGFIDDADKFDASFFSISPREAQFMDPQQRIFLQTVWKTIEDAGYKPSDLSGTKTGLYVGVSNCDYRELIIKNELDIEPHLFSGIAHSILANRISYYLNLRGPSEPVDTACSSSLISVHRAVKAIQRNECEMVIAGGINLILSPTLHICFSKAGMLSSDGKCKTFDDSADGYVRGEGSAAILLKPLSRAIEDNDHIYAVIKGSAENHGGNANTLTSPNPNAQAEVITAAFDKAKIDPSTITFIEVHGSGTRLGDPIEINGLKKAFRELYGKNNIPVKMNHCGLGTVKTNIGHLEPAAGIAAVIKVILSMKHKKVPGNIHFRNINPNINTEGSPFYIVDQNVSWYNLKDENGISIPLRAGISSFGFGGSNAHVILEDYTCAENKNESHPPDPQLIILSAKDKNTLNNYACDLLQFLINHKKEGDCPKLPDIAYTLQTGREAMNNRLAIIVEDQDELIEKLKEFCNGDLSIQDFYEGSTKESHNNSLINDELINSLSSGNPLTLNLPELAKAWVSGSEIEWTLLYRKSNCQRVSLPTYPFKKERHWLPGMDNYLNKYPDIDSLRFYIPEFEKTELNFSVQDEKTKKFTSVLFVYSESGERVAGKIKAIVQAKETWEIKLSMENKVINPTSFEINAADIDSFRESIMHIKTLDAVYFLGGIHNTVYSLNDLDILNNHQKLGLISFYRLLKLISEQRLIKKRLEINVITNGVYGINSLQNINFYSASLHGFSRAVQKEYPQTKFNIFDLSAKEPDDKTINLLSDAIKNGYTTDSEGSVIIKNHEIYRRVLVPLQLPKPAKSVFKQEGVYLIAGGSGGIGFELTKYLYKNYNASVILTGRKDYASITPGIQEFLKDKKNKITYYQADIADQEQMENIIPEIRKKCGKINGVFNSAIVLKDKTLELMDEETLISVLKPKIYGSVILYNLFKDADLDFMAFFSSVQSFICNTGQSNYAAACTCKDAFSEQLSMDSSFPVYNINWGYWGSIGIVKSDDYNKRLRMMGFGSIEQPEGMDAIERILCSRKSQVIAVKADDRILKTMGVKTNREMSDNHSSLEKKAGKFQEDLKIIEKWGIHCLLQTFRDAGIFEKSGTSYSIQELHEKLKVNEDYKRLVKEFLTILSREKFIAVNNGHEILTLQKATSPETLSNINSIQQRKNELEKLYPHHEGYIELIWRCSRNCIKIICGEILATDVMFPGSGLELVEKIYKGNPVSDYFNRLTALKARKLIKEILATSPAEKIKILEIGAGTGGTTDFVLKEICDFNQQIEFVFSDISPVFLQNAMKKYDSEYRFVNYKLLDIEKEMTSQSFKAGDYDIVLATNVLHATKNIKNTIQHVLTLLKLNGHLILNEITGKQDFATLTFGLLKGWWLFEDRDLRMEGGPLINTEGWKNILTEAGFKVKEVSDEPGYVSLPQNVFFALKEKLSIDSYAPQKKVNIIKHADNADERSARNPNLIESIVKETVRQVLKLSDDRIETDIPFMDLGADSILAIEIINTINEKFSINLRTNDFFSFPTILQLSERISWEPELKIYSDVPQQPLSQNAIEPEILKNNNNELFHDQIMSLEDILEKLTKNEIDVEEADHFINSFYQNAR